MRVTVSSSIARNAAASERVNTVDVHEQLAHLPGTEREPRRAHRHRGQDAPVPVSAMRAARPASSRATGTRNGEQDT
jgi:hypothetical protein